MNRYERYLRLSDDIIASYNGSEPFASFIKKYFAANKQLGSRDRKQISQCCFAYFRTGHLLDGLEVSRRILSALFLCSNDNHEMIAQLYPEWLPHIHLPVKDKCRFLGIDWSKEKIFPWLKYLSDEVEADSFIISHLSQPDLFLRIRNKSLHKVTAQLDAAELKYSIVGDSTIRLPNGAKVDEVLSINKDVIIQDYSSQQIADLFKHLPFKQSASFKVWDACAASGGKAILLKDFFPNALLTVSDIRQSILVNLDKRFKEAALSYEQAFVTDLSKAIPDALSSESFDLIMADIPCTGSGTWSRTPEWLRYFEEKQIAEYAALQFRIIKNIVPLLKKGGYLLYATCSVFKEENEAQIARLLEDFNLSLIASGMIRGYTHKADTMYGALLQKHK
jgi:16S rRNA (cytosine967-C5)-methyltransferase